MAKRLPLGFQQNDDGVTLCRNRFAPARLPGGCLIVKATYLGGSQNLRFVHIPPPYSPPARLLTCPDFGRLIYTGYERAANRRHSIKHRHLIHGIFPPRRACADQKSVGRAGVKTTPGNPAVAFVAIHQGEPRCSASHPPTTIREGQANGGSRQVSVLTIDTFGGW